jgi:hypothetical protein
MRKLTILVFVVAFLLLVSLAWSPRDFLTRRLARDLIAGSSAFKTPQQFWLRTGPVSNKDYFSPEYLILQHHGWISASATPCPPQLAPPPCWDVLLTPAGVDTVHNLIPPGDAGKASFSIPAAKRELLGITGISKQDGVADVDFNWRWVPLNEIGAALYSSDLHYRSTTTLHKYDDGWRVLQTAPHPGQSLDEALKNSDPAP